jgi:hypothetical protein
MIKLGFLAIGRAARTNKFSRKPAAGFAQNTLERDEEKWIPVSRSQLESITFMNPGPIRSKAIVI